MTLGEMRRQELEDNQKRRQEERLELQRLLAEALSEDSIEVLSISDNDEDRYTVKLAFTLDGFRQEDDFYWMSDESQEDFIEKAKRHVGYIKELRMQYPDYCKQNDFIQANGKFSKKLVLTHMGYNREFYFEVDLADYLKLPNTTCCSFGGGDYEIKRTPQRVQEYNKNIDLTVDFLIDCIAELKQRKWKP